MYRNPEFLVRRLNEESVYQVKIRDLLKIRQYDIATSLSAYYLNSHLIDYL